MEGSKKRRFAIASLAVAAAFVGGTILGRASAPTPTQAHVHIGSDNADLRLLLRAQQERHGR